MRRMPRKYRNLLFIGLAVLVLVISSFLLLANRFLEPALRSRLHTLIVQGSDSLYRYSLGRLDADFFGGDVSIENLRISIDSPRYIHLKRTGDLPALTMQLSLKKGHIKGVAMLPLLFGKKISIREIFTGDADIRVTRHPADIALNPQRQPLWKTMQPGIAGIAVKRIRLDGVKLLYRNEDTSASEKLQFDRFDADFRDLQVDSVAAADTSRIGFTREITLRFHDLKFRTPDSAYKMKAEWITYSSKNRTLEIDSFKMQPTLEKAEYYQIHQVQQTLYYIEFGKMRFDNFRLDQYIRHNILSADSLSISGPVLESYMDRSQLKIVESRIGKFPHQMLLRTGARINIRSIGIANGTVLYTERNNTGVEGSLRIDGLRMRMKNVTNMKEVIAANNICQADVAAMIFQSSPVAGRFTFYLDSTNGRFDFSGSVRNVSASQLAPLANALSTTRIRSFTMKELHFEVTANDYDSRSNVQMQYSQLAVDLRKTDPLTQEATTKKFLTKMVNRYMLAPQNPGADGRLRTAKDVRVQRLVTQSFFGLIWKSIFAGMQEIMMR